MAQPATHTSDGGVIQRLLQRIEDWVRKDELAYMGPDEMRQLAQDVGMDVKDLAHLAACDSDAARLLYARLEQLGFTMAEIEAKGVGNVRDLERTCCLCPDRQKCEHDLHAHPESDDWRQICPNRWTFDEMERLRAGKG